jgi:hypothetical protein
MFCATYRKDTLYLANQTIPSASPPNKYVGSNQCRTAEELVLHACGETFGDIAGACLLTTPAECSTKCSNMLAKVNKFLLNGRMTCFPTMLEIGASVGLPKSVMCNWRTPCKLNYLANVQCPAPKPSFGNKAKVSFFLSLFRNYDQEKVALALAEALNIPVGDVRIRLKDSNGRHLQAAAQDAEVTLNAKNVQAAIVLKDNIQGPSFVADFESELDDLGVNRTGATFDVSGVTEPDEIPPMGGYVVPSFKPGSAVVQFHSYSPMKKDEAWDANPNTAAGKQYLTNIAAISALAMVMAVLAMLEYWIFLCGHNCGGCCTKVCGCCNKKGAWGGEKVARPLLAFMFIVTLITMCTSLTGRNHFQSGLTEVGNVLGEAADLFKTVELSVGKLTDASTVFKEAGAKAKVTSPLPPPRGTGLGCDTKDTGESLETVGGGFATASEAMAKMVDGMSDKILKMKKQVTEDGPPMLDGFVIATVALFFPWALFGLIGVGMGSRCPRMSDGFLNCVAFLGLVILWIVAIMIAIELAVGVMFADFCFEDPLVAMASLVNQNMDGEQADLMTFYLDCAKGQGNDFNPINENLIKASQTAELLGGIAEGVGMGGTCNPETLNKVWAPGTGASPMVVQAIGDIQDSFACQNVNPMLVNLTHTALCEDTINGIASLFMSQVVAVMFMLVTLHYASFTRPYMNATPYSPSKVEPEGKDEPENSVAAADTAPMEGTLAEPAGAPAEPVGAPAEPAGAPAGPAAAGPV